MKKSSKCAVCCDAFRASICAACVNHRLNEYKILLHSQKSRRKFLYSKVNDLLVIKGIGNAQQSWRDLKNEKLARLREKLQHEMEKLQKRKATFGRQSHNLKARYDVIESANVKLEKNRVGQLEKHYSDTIGNYYLVYIEVASERLYKQALVMKQICKLFPLSRVSLEEDSENGCSGRYDQICNVRLPQGLNPLSVPPKELAASLGYMVQLLNLVIHKLAVPALHNLGFGGSCSRIWQRDSYWNTRPSSPSKEYPLFIQGQDYHSTNVQNSWTSRGPTNFGVTSIKSDGSPEPDSYDLDVVSCLYASPHTVDTYRDLQKGIALLKQSVAHITVNCYSSLHLEFPSASSTFEAFAKLLVTLSSFKEVQSALSLGLSSSSKQEQQLKKSVWKLNASSSSTFLNSTHTEPTLGNCSYYNVPNSAPSYMVEFLDVKKDESSIGGWNLIEHPGSPHQAMFINAKKS